MNSTQRQEKAKALLENAHRATEAIYMQLETIDEADRAQAPYKIIRYNATWLSTTLKELKDALEPTPSVRREKATVNGTATETSGAPTTSGASE